MRDDIDFSAISLALDNYDSDYIDVLTESAINTYIFSSLFAYAKLLRKKIVPNRINELLPRNEIKSILEMEYPIFSSKQIDTLKPHITTDAKLNYVDKYRDELLKGGRTVAIGKWSEPNAEGVKTYLGYEKKWVPWLENKTTNEREYIYSVITSGKSRSDIAEDLKTVFNQRANHNELVARSEVLNNARIIQTDSWKREGITKFIYVCSSQPGSPCEDLCAPMCGQIFDAGELPMDGEIMHPHCMCSLMPITSDITPSSWNELEPAQSSQFYKDTIAEQSIGKTIEKSL